MRRFHWVIASVLWCATACQQDVSSPGSELSYPSGMAVGGTTVKRVFVANAAQSALQMLQVANASLTSLEFERATLPYFARRLYVGGYPTDVVSLNGGRWLAVWDAAGAVLKTVDADALRVVPAVSKQTRGVPWENTGAVLLMPDSFACEAPCMGRFYAVLHEEGKVLSVQLDMRDNVYESSVVNTYDFGQPLGHATVGTGFVFAALAESFSVMRMRLDTQASDILDTGAEAGMLALSSDGSTLVVSRPLFEDVITVADATGAWHVQASNAVVTPDPACVHACAETSSTCVDAHPSNSAVCASEAGGVSDTAHPYDGVYLGGVVSSMLPLGAALGHDVVATCTNVSGEERFNQAMLVATSNGYIHFVGLATPQAGPTPARLLSEGCGAPSLETQTPGLLEACLNTPAHAASFACAQQGTAGVVLHRSTLLNDTFQLQWESVLPGMARTQGGALAEDGTLFGDTLADVTGGGAVQPGDVLQITSQPLRQCTVDPDGVYNGLCALERVVTGIVQKDGRSWLALNKPLPTACYPFAGTVAYQIRAGNTFVLSSARTPFLRTALGDTVGWGSSKATYEPWVFKLTSADPQTAVHACDKYDANGAPKGSLNPLFSRANAWSFTVKDPFSPVSHSTAFLGTSSASGQLDKMPLGMITLTGVSDKPAVLVAFSASNSVMAFVPFAASSTALAASSHVIR